MRPVRLLAALALVSQAAFAQAPQVLGYQGRLLQSDGTAATGVVDVTFGIYDVPEFGPSLWSETQHLALTDGYYATYLGLETPFPAGLFDGRDLYLDVRVDGDSLVPRQRIGSVAYALYATEARNVSGGAVDATSISVGGRTVIDGSGRLVGEGAVSAGPGIEVSAENTVALMSCPAGEILESDGSGWVCGADDDTVYTDADAVAAVAATDAYVPRDAPSTVTGDLDVQGPLTIHGTPLKFSRARFYRDGGTTMHFTAPDGSQESLDLGSGTSAATGSLMAFRPGGSGDSALYFNIDSGSSIACTLLHNEDDAPVRGWYYATDGGNGMTGIWGDATTGTFILRREGAGGHVLGTNQSFDILCF